MMSNRLLAGLPAVHPGDVLREDILPALSVSRGVLAEALCLSRQGLYNLLQGKAPMSTATALRLEKLVGGSAEMWLNLQRDYDLAIERAKIGTDLEKVRALEAA